MEQMFVSLECMCKSMGQNVPCLIRGKDSRKEKNVSNSLRSVTEKKRNEKKITSEDRANTENLIF